MHVPRSNLTSAAPKALELLSASLIAAPLAAAVAGLATNDPRRIAQSVHTLKALADAARLPELRTLAHDAEMAMENDAQGAVADLALTALRTYGDALSARRAVVSAPREIVTTWANTLTLFAEATQSFATMLGKVATLNVHASTALHGEDLTILMGLVLHLMRNAIAHGLEGPTARTARGKLPHGRLELTLDVVNGVLFGRFSDDGQGIDQAAIVTKARDLGLWKGTGTPRTLHDFLSLLTAPGFTTATTEAKLFGRGVGLEAVRRVLVEADGELRLERTGPSGTALTFSWALRQGLRAA